MKYRLKTQEIDLAAVNKHHVPGTAYHWKHGYIPLDARTAQLWGKKHHVARLIAEGRITTHEPDGRSHETNAKPSRATHALVLHAIERKAEPPKVEPQKTETKRAVAKRAVAPKAPKKTVDEFGLSDNQRKAAREYVNAHRALAKAIEQRRYDRSAQQKEVHRAAQAAHAAGLDITLPEGPNPWDLGRTESLGGGVSTHTMTHEESMQSNMWHKTHQKNMLALHAASGNPRKLKYDGRYGMSLSEHGGLSAHLGRNINAVPKEEKPKAPETRTAMEALHNPQKGDVYYPAGERGVYKGNNGHVPKRFRWTGTTWRQQEQVNGEWSDSSPGSRSTSYFRSKEAAIKQAKRDTVGIQYAPGVSGSYGGTGLAANPEHGWDAVSHEEVAAAADQAAKDEFERRNEANKALTLLHYAKGKAQIGEHAGWKHLSAVDFIKATQPEMVSMEGAAFGPDDMAQRLATLTEQAEKIKPSYYMQHESGHVLRIEQHNANHHVKNLLDTIGHAHELTKGMNFDGKPITFSVGKEDPKALGWVMRHDPHTVNISPSTMNLGNTPLKTQDESSPYANTVKVLQDVEHSQLLHTVIHEMGHLHDFQNGHTVHGHEFAKGDNPAERGFHREAWAGRGKMYGASKAVEGYAEAFTTHVLHTQHGKSESKDSGIAKKYGERYSWSSASSRTEKAAEKKVS